MNRPDKIGVVCEKFPLVSQTFVLRHAEVLDAEIFALELTATIEDPAWAGRVHAAGITPGRNRRRVLAERIYRRLFHPPWRIWLPGEQRKLCDQLRERNIAAVIVEFGQCLVGCGERIFDAGARVVPYFHGVDLSAHLRDARYVRKLRPLLHRCADAIVVNELMIGRLRNIFGFRGRIHFVPCAADDALFAHQSRAPHPGFKFLFVGRLVEKKGVVELVRAFARYVELGGQGDLVIAGDGPERASAEEAVLKAALASRVDFKGPVTHEHAATLMHAADIYVQHSKVGADGDEEGWPVAIAEACLAGLPVVATCHAGIPQQVISGQTGWLVQEGDIEGMARAMLALAQSAALRETYGRAAQQHIRKFCDSAAYRIRLREILHNPESATS